MATNNSKVTKILIIISDNRVTPSRSSELIHAFDHGGMSWKLTFLFERSESGQNSNLITITSYLTLTTSGASNDSVVRTDEIDNAKIEILGKNEIPIFSFIGKWPLNWIRVCNLTCLFQNHRDSVPDGKYKAILSVGPLKLLTPASKDAVAPSVPQDKSPMESLKSMLDEGILTDVVIKTSTKTFPCHKVVLASSSEVFKAMFETEMKESTDNEVKLEGVFDSATVQDLLHYLYTKQTPPNINNTCSTLFVAADYFQLPVLKAVCEEKLCTMIIVENAADVLQLAEKYNADALKKTAVNFIVSHYKDVMNTPGWKEIPDDMTRYLLSTFLVTVAEKMKI